MLGAAPDLDALRRLVSHLSDLVEDLFDEALRARGAERLLEEVSVGELLRDALMLARPLLRSVRRIGRLARIAGAPAARVASTQGSQPRPRPTPRRPRAALTLPTRRVSRWCIPYRAAQRGPAGPARRPLHASRAGSPAPHTPRARRTA
jgi:hypothetical protein